MIEPNRDHVDETPAAARARDFSAQLEARLKSAPRVPSETTRLAVRIGTLSFLVDMTIAGEIVPFSAATPVPWTRPWFRGLVNVRGRLVGVIDLLELAGRGGTSADQSLQLLVLGDSLKVSAALIITRAFGLRNLNDLEALPAPADAAAAPPALRWERQRWRDAEGNAFAELDLRELVASENFATIGL